MDQAFLEKYSPANTAKLTTEDILAMQEFTSDELKALAQRYPNGPTGNNYLKLWNKQLPADKQLLPETTWQNLYNLRKNTNKDNFVALTFTVLYNASKAKPKTLGAVKMAPVVDLTKTDLKSAPGVKKLEEEKLDDEPKDVVQLGQEPAINNAEVLGEKAQKPAFDTMGFEDLKKSYKELLGEEVPATLNNKKALAKILNDLWKEPKQ